MITVRSKKVDFVNSTTINDAKNYRLISLKKEGKSYQEVVEPSPNLYNYKDTNEVSEGITVDDNGWITISYDNTNGTEKVVLKYLTNNLKLQESKAYTVIAEVKNVSNSGTGIYFYPNNGGQWSWFEGQFATSRIFAFNDLSNNSIKIFQRGTRTSFDNVTGGIGTAVEFGVGTSGSITFRLSVLEDLSITEDAFVYFPYIQYIEQKPTPDNPSEIKSIKGTNLLKGLSTSNTDTTYWNNLNKNYFTPLADGWGRWVVDNTSGTSTIFANAMVNLSAIDLKPSTTYTFVVEIRNSTISESSGAYLQVITNNATGAFKTGRLIGYLDINENKTIVFNSITKDSFNGVTRGVDTYLRLSAGTKGTVEARISLFEYGNNTSSTYVPYNSIQSKIVGKNLFNKNSSETQIGYFTSDGTFKSGGGSTVTTTYTKIVPNNNMTISGIKLEWLCFYDKNKNFIERIAGASGSTSNTFNKNANYIRFQASTSIFDLEKIQLELGTQATEYETYQENILNIDLQGNELCSLPNNIKDELVVENGRAKIIKNVGKVVLNGSEVWKRDTTNQFYSLIIKSLVKASSVLISNYFEYSGGWRETDGIFIGETGAMGLINTKVDNVSDLITWLSTHNTIVYYELATSTEIDLGAVILPETFEGINNINVSSNLDSNTSIVYVNEIVEFKSSLIKVYDSVEKTFATNGIKTLHPLLAEVTKKDNGDYYLELRDTLDNLDYYQKGMIIRCITPWGVQGFRCDNPIINNKRSECKAWHLSYDSKNYIIKDAYAVDKNCNDALNHFNSSTDKTSPFTCVSDIAKIVSTRAVRKTLFEVYEWLITDEKYGGHWYRDNWNLSIKSSIGEDRGVVLAQNKNITDLKISENWDDVCTKILPYTTDGENAILLDDTYVEVGEELYDLPYSKVIKFENQLKQEDYETYDAFLLATKTWLEAQANSYLQENKFPKINYSVSAKIDNISDVGDVIHVKHPKCKVDITTNVIGITYDVNRDKYIKIEFGNFKKEIKNLAQEISETVKKDTENKIEEAKNLLQKELEDSTSKINNTFGNSYVIYEGDKILVVDTLPKENAKYVIKISSGGIGFSQNGINGTFTSAWTIDGTLNMQNINVINLTASLIKGGTLKLGGLNNSSGTFELYDETGRLMLLEDKTGLTVYALNGDYVKLNADVGFAGYNKNDIKIYWADGEVFHMRNAEVENELKVAGMIKFVPVNTSDNRGIGIVAIPG